MSDVLVTIEIDERGGLVQWTASDLQGNELENWRLMNDRPSHATSSHTWEIDEETTYPIVRDILRYLGEEDWEPDAVEPD